MKLKRTFALLLALVLTLGLFAGCGKDKDPEEQNDDKTNTPSSSEETVIPQAKFAWKASYQPVLGPDGQEVDYVNQYCVAGDYLYYAGSYVAGKETVTDPETGEPILDETTGKPVEFDRYEEGLFQMELSTGTTSLMSAMEQPELPEGYEGNSYIQSMMAGSDDTLWLLERTNTYYYDLPENFDPATDQQWNYYVEGETFTNLKQYGADGQKLQTIQLDVPAESYIDRLLMDGKGNLYASDWQQMYIYDSTGALKHTLTHEQGIGEPVKLDADTIGITTWTQDYSKMVFLPVDAETGTFGEEIPLVMNAYQIQPGSGDYQYYYSDSDSIYGVAEGAEAGEKLLSWLDCDVDSNNLNGSFHFLSDGRIVALERDYSSPDGKTQLILLEQVDASTIPQKQELVLGCFGLDYNLRPMIVDFNRSNQNVRIVVRDYSELMGDGTYEDALQRMNTEILTGNAPDLMSLNGLPKEQYAAKGILMDLWPLIDSDPELTREDLMTHLFDVMSIDGKLYEVTDSFYIQTAACRTAITGDRDSWTLEDVLAAMEGLQPDAGIFSETDTKTGILNQCLGYNLDSFMDWNNKTCSFDSEEFISILEFANTFPAEMDPNYDWATAESEYSRLMNGKQLMTTCYISSFGDLQVQYAFHGGDVNFIGFPSANGTGSCFNLGSTISISSACKDPTSAWQFVRRLLLEEHQTDEHMWNFPTNKASFDAYVEQAMTPQYYTDPETGEQVEQSTMGYGIGNDFQVDIYAMKQPEYDAFLKLYNSVKTVYSYDQEIMNIILEECEFFFAGQKTAADTANIIQNRLSLYLAEQG